MKRWTVFLIALAAALSLCASPILAQGHAGGAGGQHGGGPGGQQGPSAPHGGGAKATVDPSGGKGAKGGAETASGEAMTKILARPDSKLVAKLQAMLPTGTNMQDAATGFKSLGRFVAAVHVANNLGISFDDLKKAMMGPPAESLGKAIHTLKPDVDAKAETKKANKQADDDIKESETSS